MYWKQWTFRFIVITLLNSFSSAHEPVKILQTQQILHLLPVSNDSTGWKDKSIVATLSLRSCRGVNLGNFGELRLQSTHGVHESPQEQSMLELGLSILARSKSFLFCHGCTDLVLAAVHESKLSPSCWITHFWTFNSIFELFFSDSKGIPEFFENALSGVRALVSMPLPRSEWTLRLLRTFAVSTRRSLALLFVIETMTLFSGTCLCFSRLIGLFLTRTAL